MRSLPSLCLALSLYTSLPAQQNLPGQVPAKSDPLTFAQVAEKTGLKRIEIEILQEKKGLSLRDILEMTDESRKLLLDRLVAPTGADQAIALRLMQRRDANGLIPPDAMMTAQSEAEALDQTDGLVGGLNSAGWSELGPGNIGGRVRALVVHPTTTTTLFCGGVAGGIWRSTNSGATWVKMEDDMDNLAISTIRFDPASSSIMYAGTGEGFGNGDAIRGAGIWRSTNSGSSWTRLASTANSNFYYVNELSLAGNVILAATRTGIWRSTNGGTSWTRTRTGDCRDVAFHPNNNNRVVAFVRVTNSVIYSSNAGQTWSNASGIATGTGRVEFAWHAGYTGVNPGYVYALKDGGSGNSRIYRSANAGQTWVLVSTTSILGGQGWYDNTIAVMPYPRDTNYLNDVIICGGIDIWRSTNGGGSFTKISRWSSWPTSAHADQHVIVPHPRYNGTTNRQVYFGNDGGVWRANNVLSVSQLSGWTNLNTSLGITQFYGASRNDSSGILVGGTQDNGTLRDTDSSGFNSWTRPSGADGGFTASDPTNSNYHYMEYQNGVLRRSTNGGTSASTLRSFTGSLFIAPFILDPNNANRLLYGAGSLWRSNNIKAGTPSWSSIHSASGAVSAIAVAEGNSNICWVAYSNGNVYYSTNATSASPTWTRRDGTSLPNRFPTRIVIDPSNTSRVYVCFGGYSTSNIYRTTNSGASWSALTGLPSAPVRDLEINPKVSNVLYAATEVGLMVSEDNGSSWSSSATPNKATIDEMFIADGDTLYLVTHGRGIFRQRFATPSGGLTSLYYRLDEGLGTVTENLGTNATRSSRVVHVGTGSNGPWATPGRYGEAMLMGSSNSSSTHSNYVDTRWNGPLAGDFTISFYARRRYSPGTGLSYLFGGLGSFRAFTNGVAGTGLWVRDSGAGDIKYPGNFQSAAAAGACIALTVNNSTKRAQWYLNGVATGSPIAFTGDVHVPAGSSSFKIGRSTSDTSSSVYDIDEFRLEQRVCSAAEIKAWCDGQSTLHYKFDRGAGLTVVNYGAGPLLSSRMVAAGTPSWASPGKFGPAMLRASNHTSSTQYNYCDTGWTGPVQGSLSISFWCKQRFAPGSGISYLFGGIGSFRAFTNGVASTGLWVRSWGGADLKFPNDNFQSLAARSQGVCVGLTIDANTREAQWYVDGAAYGDPIPVTSGANVAGGTSTFKIGKNSSNTSSSCYDIDEFRLENYAGNASEMRNWCLSTAAAGQYGRACGMVVGTLGGDPVIGNSRYAHTVRFQQRVSGPALFVIGVKPAPEFDMGIVFPQLKGCTWWAAFQLEFVLPVPASGLIIQGGVPRQSNLVGLHLVTQALSITKAGYYQSNAVSHVIELR